MFCKFLLAVLLSVPAVSVYAADAVELDYHYAGKHGIDFSHSEKGPLKIGPFQDLRTADGKLITGADGAPGYRSAQPLADVVRSALEQGIQAGNGRLVSSGENLLLSGDLTQFSAATKDGLIEVTVKATVRLNKTTSGNRVFNGKLFGRAQVPEQAGIAAAISASLDQLVNSLLWDDYFLMQVVD